VPKRERPRAIMRLHAGFRQSPGPFPVAKVVDWISVPLASPPCATSSRTSRTTRRDSP
jgi:hypothetical protein